MFLAPLIRRWRSMSRGQALVEFAIVLPVLALLLVMALDFGRVYFGWVSMTNAARVGANFAAQHSDAWSANRTADKDEFVQLIRDNVGGCTLTEPIADPEFNPDRTPEAPHSSDLVKVTINCDFGLITPLAGDVLGNGGVVVVAAQSTFPVRGQYDGPTGGGGGNVPCAGVRVPDLRLKTVTEAQQFWTDSGFTGAFTANPSGQPDYIVQSQTLTPSANVNDCVDPSSTVFVTVVAPPPCPSGQAQVPNLIGLSLTDARAAWVVATFTGPFNPSSGNNSQVVLTQTTSPGSVPNGCLVQTASMTVTYGNPPPPQCPVPNMVNHTVTEAQNMWSAAGFTRALTITGHNATVQTQDPGFPGDQDCAIHGKVTT